MESLNSDAQKIKSSSGNWKEAWKILGGRLPYLALELRHPTYRKSEENYSGTEIYKIRKENAKLAHKANEKNLIQICDNDFITSEFVLSVKDKIKLAIQICDLLDEAHKRKVFFYDHKIIHYYWSKPLDQVYIIDWNMGMILPEDTDETENETRFDLS